MMGCQSHNLEDALEERVRALVTEQVQSHAEAMTELVRDLGLVRAELSALKEQVQSHAATDTLVRDQGLELSALKESIHKMQDQMETKTSQLELVKRGQELDTKEIKLELDERQASNQRLREDLDVLITKSTSESEMCADPHGLDDAMLKAKLSNVWIEFDKLRAEIKGISASGGTGGRKAAGFDRMKVVELLNGAKNLSGADLTGLDLSCLDFTGASLKHANMTDTTLTHAILTNVDAEGADFSGVDLSCLDFGCATLTGAKLVGATLTNANLSNVVANRADFSGANVAGATLTGMRLQDARFGVCGLASATFDNLVGASLDGLDLAEVDLKGKHVTCAVFANVVNLAKVKSADTHLVKVQVQAAGCSLKQLKLLGYSAFNAKRGLYSAKEAKEAGYSCKEAKEAGYSCKDAKEVGYSCKDAKDVGYSCKEAKEAGHSCKEVKEAGYSCMEAQNAGFSGGAGFQVYACVHGDVHENFQWHKAANHLCQFSTGVINSLIF